MQHTLAAVFDDRSAAQQAKDALLQAGFRDTDIHLNASGTLSDSGQPTTGTLTGHTDESIGERIKHFFADLFGTEHEDTHVYTEAVNRGKCVLTLTCDSDERMDEASDIVERFSPVDIDEHADQWRAGGWIGASGSLSAGYQSGTSSSMQTGQTGSSMKTASSSQQRGETLSRSGSTSAEQRIPVMQEDLQIGKREVERGGVRVYQHLVETPVKQDVHLRDERVKVQRRPVDRPADPADLEAFKETSFELRERAEEAVVNKTARVVEEVVIGKEVQERDQPVTGKVRRTQVDVEPLGKSASYDSDAVAYGSSARSRYAGRTWDDIEPNLRTDWENAHPGSAWDKFKASVRQGWDRMTGDSDEDYYRSHWSSNYGSTAGNYEDYEPAYKYGSTMASNELYRGRKWDDVEPELRRNWETSNPGSAWDRFKAAVRHGWDRMTS
jgi:uncharacterized protein (TIGR02271 family)